MTDANRRRNAAFAASMPRAALENRVRYPGAPVESPGVRLPEIPEGLAYDAPMTAPILPQLPPAQGRAIDYETASREIDFIELYRTEKSLYKTSSHWSDCDVLMVLPDQFWGIMTMPGDAVMISVFVYAVAGAARVLVASGRFDALTEEGVRLKWMTAARGAASERFEVTARLDWQNATVGYPVAPPELRILAAVRAQASFVIVACDDLPEPPEDVGAITRMAANGTAIGGAIFNGATWDAPPALEVLAMTGVNTAAAARYLILSESLAGVPGGGLVVLPMGALAGAGAWEFSVRKRIRFVDSGGPGIYPGPALTVSSTAPAITPSADGVVTIKVR